MTVSLVFTAVLGTHHLPPFRILELNASFPPPFFPADIEVPNVASHDDNDDLNGESSVPFPVVAMAISLSAPPPLFSHLSSSPEQEQDDEKWNEMGLAEFQPAS
jgi:hypothetical protein